MENRKFTPEEIAKSLRHCAEVNICGDECLYRGLPDCSAVMILDAAQVIEELAAVPEVGT